MVEYIKATGTAEGTKVNNIKVRFDYYLGGINYATYRNEPRGYYAYFTPVNRETREGGWTSESYTMFAGFKVCLLEVTRKGKKAEAEALKIFEAEKQKYIEHLIKTYDLIIEEQEGA